VTPSKQVRLSIRDGTLRGNTASCAPGYVQGNVAILPANLAEDFRRFCVLNPKPCPLLAVGEPGDPALLELGDDIDIRIDVPAYRVFRHGALVEECGDILSHWRDDLVTFILGCSYSFEEALLKAGLHLRHHEQGTTVPMYRTSIATEPSGDFGGAMVVSMRPFRPADADKAYEITGRYPRVHGAPVHVGDPQAIGIADIMRPDFGEPAVLRDGEIPIFWACGVTPQVAIERAKPDLFISHAPGAMLVTDLWNEDLADV